MPALRVHYRSPRCFEPKAMVRCEHCGKEFEDHDIIMHTQVCEKAPHECIYCHQMIPADVKEQHKLECVKRPVSCEHCGEEMAFDMLAGHGTSCRLSVPITCKFVLFRAILVNSLTGSRELRKARSRQYRRKQASNYVLSSDADFCKYIFVGKILTRSTTCTYFSPLIQVHPIVCHYFCLFTHQISFSRARG